MGEFVIDAFGFCKRGEHLSGEIAVEKLQRLAKESIGSVGSIRWALQGGTNRLRHPQMILQVEGSVQLLCQRCLMPFDFDIGSEAVLVLAPNEQSADEIDVLLDDESIEVIVGSAAMNVLELVEDEALLALPLSPRHDACPHDIGAIKADLPKRESPFSVLKNIKK